MNIKLINSKLDFLEELIVEMNPENLEQLKTICFSKISELQNQLVFTDKNLGQPLDKNLKLLPQSFSELKEVVVDYFEFEVVKEDNT